ncbi:MAG: hypothetical protein KGM49_07475 [Sphingomonadales bacterium]|nr:hypothetical protein [Sphingomonadales bacterium]
MNFGDVMGLALVVGGVIAIFAVVMEGYKARCRVREREIELKLAQSGASSLERSAAVEILEDRVRVLERIATDRGNDIAMQIEALRELPKN